MTILSTIKKVTLAIALTLGAGMLLLSPELASARMTNPVCKVLPERCHPHFPIPTRRF